MKLPKFSYDRRQKILILIILSIVLVAVGIVVYQTVFNSAEKQFQKESKAVYESMVESQAASLTVHSVDQSRIAEIISSIQAGKYVEAKNQTEKILSEPNLTDADKRTLYTLLSQICLPLQDLTCVDKVVGQYGGLTEVDINFLVASGELAQKFNQPVKSKLYFAKALAEIESKGGKSYIDGMNAQSEKPLNYEEIKAGASQ